MLNIGGDVVELNPNQFKMFNTLDSAEDLGLLDSFLKTTGIVTGKHLKLIWI